MALARSQTRLLWNEPSVVGFVALALLVTLGIIAWQMNLRTGLMDPYGLPIFYRLFLFEDYYGAFLFVLVLLVALVPGLQSIAASAAMWIGARPIPVAVSVTFLLAAGALWAYQARPLAMDESAPYMQAQIFAAGALVGQFPSDLLDWLVYPPFQDYFIHVSHETGQIASAYWPGFALLLTPFMALGVPWLCNPVLGGLSVWMVHRLALELTSSTAAAGAAVLFSLGSATFVANAIGFYSMTAHLLCNGLFVLLLLRPTWQRALTAGLVGGLALTLHNPLPHMLFALPWLGWLALRPERRRLLPAIAIGYLPWVTIVGFGWQHLLQGLGEGGPAVSGDAASPIVSALNKLAGVLKMPGLSQLFDRAIGLAKLWLWAAPLLVLLAGVAFWRGRNDVRVRLLGASAILTFVGYVFVPLSQGHGWGFRYMHSAWFVLPVLAGLQSWSTQPGGAPAAAASPSALSRYALSAALGGLLVMIPYCLWQVHAFASQHLAQVPTSDHGRPKVVIINPMLGYYAQDLVLNDPFLRDPVLRMITHGRQDDEAMMARHFPDLVVLSRDYRGTVWGHATPDLGESPDTSVAGPSIR